MTSAIHTEGGATGNTNICNMWKDHYEILLNSSKDGSKTSSVTNVLRCADKHSYVPGMPLEVKESISNLKKGNSAGNDHVNCEHFI